MAEKRTVVKAVKNAKLFSDGTIALSDIRFSHPHLAEKWSKPGSTDTPAYSMVAILPNDTHKEARELCLERVTQLLKENNKGVEIKDDALFVRDGKPTKKPEYADAWTVNSRDPDSRPIVLNPDKSEMAIEDIKPTIKPGYRGDVLIRPWWQDNVHGKRVNAGLISTRYRREDTLIGESRIDKDEAISSFDDDDDGGFGGDDDDGNGGL